MPHRHAVMVDDDDALASFVDLLAFQQSLLVGIDDDQQGVRRDDVQRLVRGDKVVSLTCFDKRFQQWPCQRGLAVNGNDGGHTAHLAHPQHTDRRADGIQVAHTVAHNDDAVAALDKVAQRVGDNAAADVAALLHAVGNAAVELKAVYGFYGGLVSAAAKGNVNTLAGHLMAFL